MVDRRFGQLLATAALIAASACERQAPAPPPKVVPAEKPSEPAPLAKPELDRQALIVASLKALTAAALGRGDADIESELKNRKFTLRSRFGCAPAGEEKGAAGWTYDQQSRVLRVKLPADLVAQFPLAGGLLGDGYEAAAGFVLQQPWLLAPGCVPDAFEPIAAPQVAIGQFFTADDSRAQRPPATLQLTKDIEPAEVPSKGLDLVVSGRIAPLADGRSIHCGAGEGVARCVISAKVDRVAIENPMSRTTLAEWSSW